MSVARSSPQQIRAKPPTAAAIQRYFLPLVLLITACGVARSSWATALDGFTIDEAYHIAAGATYLRLHDFRINPEHPPLVKLVAGVSAPASILHLSALPQFDGKEQERRYAENAVYTDSDPQVIQHRARIAMFIFNSALLVILAVVLRRLFHPVIALVALGVLLLDPTVAAHLPVVMTDLPLALLGAISISLAALVLRDGRWSDALWLGLSTGLLLATKHSAPLVAVPIAVGCIAYLIYCAAEGWPWTRIATLLTVATLLAVTVLWGLYGFCYTESGTTARHFNRPLELKISDLESSRSRTALTFLSRFHLAPRAYIWGLADTMRAGLEGRADEAHVFARSYETRTPPWVPLALLAIKIPLGIMALAFAGCVFLLPGKLPPAMRWPLIGFVAAGLFFLGFVCLKGVPYAGVRHLLFLIPVAALLAAVALERIFTGRSRALWAFAIVGVLAACVSALPQRRPWEYHNLLSGGSGNAWKHFNNEGVDLGQRSTELIAFFNSHKVDRDVHIGYWMPELLVKRAGIPRSSMDFDKPISADVSGWFYMRAPDLAPRNHNDLAALREATPEARFGNLLIYHGTFHLPGYVADAMYWRAQQLSYLNPPEPEKAERLLHRVMELDPHSYTAAIDLGNFALKRKEFAAAVSWYRAALENAPPQFRGNIAEQIAKLSTPQAAVAVSPLHNPSQE